MSLHDEFLQKINDYAQKFQSVTDPNNGYSRMDLSAMAQAHLALASYSIVALMVMVDFKDMDEEVKFLEEWKEDFAMKIEEKMEDRSTLGLRVSGLTPENLPGLMKDFNEYMKNKYGEKHD